MNLTLTQWSLFFKAIEKLPEGIEFYEIEGQMFFPIKNTNELICYLIKRGNPLTGKGYYKYGIAVKDSEDPWNVHKCIQNGIKEFTRHLENECAKPFDPNGGNMGTGDNK